MITAASVVVNNYHWSAWHTCGVILSIFGGIAALIFIIGLVCYVFENDEWPWDSFFEMRIKKHQASLDFQTQSKTAEYKHQEEMAKIEAQKYYEQNKIIGG